MVFGVIHQLVEESYLFLALFLAQRDKGKVFLQIGAASLFDDWELELRVLRTLLFAQKEVLKVALQIRCFLLLPRQLGRLPLGLFHLESLVPVEISVQQTPIVSFDAHLEENDFVLVDQSSLRQPFLDWKSKVVGVLF